jgi:hypothetical protein
MVATLSQQDYWDLTYSEVEPCHSLSVSDCTWTYNSEVGKGNHRVIQIRDGIELEITQDYFHQDLKVTTENRNHPLEFGYTIIGAATSNLDAAGAGQYIFCGSGMAPGAALHIIANQRNLRIGFHMEPDVLRQWI